MSQHPMSNNAFKALLRRVFLIFIAKFFQLHSYISPPTKNFVNKIWKYESFRITFVRNNS
jgi:hypothetical protein